MSINCLEDPQINFPEPEVRLHSGLTGDNFTMIAFFAHYYPFHFRVVVPVIGEFITRQRIAFAVHFPVIAGCGCLLGIRICRRRNDRILTLIIVGSTRI